MTSAHLRFSQCVLPFAATLCSNDGLTMQQKFSSMSLNMSNKVVAVQIPMNSARLNKSSKN
jgi:hypothetical protein